LTALIAVIVASLLLLGLVAARASRNATKAPAVGTPAPDFTLNAQDGKQVSLRDFRGQWVVLYFYPKDFTSGCTKEARNFQHDLALYEQKKYGAAIKQYRKAIALDESASFYSNMGAALFSTKKFEDSAKAYQRALELDPDVFERSSRQGVQAQVPRPEDRARYDYTVAKLYAKMGFSDRSLEYLRKAMEEGYKDFKNVYKDEEFATLRKDKRFTELMASKNPALPE